MKLIIRAVLFCALATVARSADLKRDPMGAVIAEIMAHPDYHQMCDGHEFDCKTIPLPIYCRLLGRTIGIAPRQLDVLKSRREELVPALKTALGSLHPEKPPTADGVPAKGESASARQLNAIFLFLVSDLHVIEALPELLLVEERLRGAIQFADEHPRSPLPNVSQDGRISHYEKQPPSERERFLEFCRADQREILGLILRLLREQRFPPLLVSSFERHYREAVEEAAAKRDEFGRGNSSAIQEQQSLAEEANRGSDFLIPFRADGDQLSISTPFDAATRNNVRRLARQFIETVPPEQWKHVAP